MSSCQLRVIPDKLCRAHAAAYRRMRRVPDWLLFVLVVLGAEIAVLTVWNLRMGVW